MKVDQFTKPLVAMFMICLAILASGQIDLVPSAKASAPPGDLLPMAIDVAAHHPCSSVEVMHLNSRTMTISKMEVRKKIRFLFSHPKVRNGIIEALREHPKVALDFFYSYEGNDQKGLKKSSKAFAAMLASPMADLLATAGKANQTKKAKEAFVKGLAVMLASDVFLNIFGEVADGNQNGSQEQCDLLKRNIDMTRKRALDANLAWYLCAIESEPGSDACDLLWENYRKMGEEWKKAIDEYIAGGCAE